LVVLKSKTDMCKTASSKVRSQYMSDHFSKTSVQDTNVMVLLEVSRSAGI